jgi:HD superfamily phosphohydrolase YqeK
MPQTLTSDSVLSPLVRDAARGVLPSWTQAGSRRRAHIARVAALMESWARALGLPDAEVQRWSAAAWLHDALREANPDELRAVVGAEFRELPGKILHGPAAADRLAGHADDEIRDAIRYHTLGSARWGRLGRALYLADFMEPGRTWDPEYTAALRARMPHEMDAILSEVVRMRVDHIRRNGGVPHPETQAFYEQVVQARP